MKKRWILAIVAVLFLGFIVLVASSSNDSSSNGDTNNGMSAADVKEQATAVTSTNLQRNAQNMTGKPIKITGQVFDIQGNTILLFTKKSYGTWMDDVVYVNVQGTTPDTLIKDDVVTIYAEVNGKTEYDTAVGGSNKVPEVTVYPENIIMKT